MLRLRFDIGEGKAERLYGSARLEGWRSGLEENRGYRREWFDEAGRNLHEAGILAWRECEDGNWRYGFVERDPALDAKKAPRASLVRMSAGKPDAAAIASLFVKSPALVADPLLGAEVKERRFGLEGKKWRGLAMIQEGDFFLGGETRKFSEAEFCLAEGEKSDFLADIKSLATDCAFVLMPSGGILEGHGPGWEQGPVRARNVHLHEEMDGESAFIACFGESLRQLAANAPQAGNSRDPEIIHQMRVAIRRMRAVMAIFRPFMTGADGQALLSEIKWLTGLLGAARDLDVFIAEILDPAGREFGREIAGLRSLFMKRRAVRYRAVRTALESPQFACLLFDALAWAENGEWRRAKASKAARRRPAGEHAVLILDKRRRRAVSFGKELEHMTPEERHRARIEIKKLRYAAEFFQSLFSHDEARSYRKRLGRLQDRLGELNDIAVAVGLLHEMAGKGDHERKKAADIVIGWHAPRLDELLKSAAEDWRRFLDQEIFWR